MSGDGTTEARHLSKAATNQVQRGRRRVISPRPGEKGPRTEARPVCPAESLRQGRGAAMGDAGDRDKKHSKWNDEAKA